jgi:hypothetical protein
VIASIKGIEKYPVSRPRREDVVPTRGSHFQGPLDVLLALDLAEIRRREKRDIFLFDPGIR